jgi:hypothetical protein
MRTFIYASQVMKVVVEAVKGDKDGGEIQVCNWGGIARCVRWHRNLGCVLSIYLPQDACKSAQERELSLLRTQTTRCGYIRNASVRHLEN